MNDRAAIAGHFLQGLWRQSGRFADRAALERWQENQIQKLLAWVLPRSPYHQARFAGLNRAQWRNIRPVEKADLMENFDPWNTAGIRLEEAMNIALQAESSRDFSPLIRHRGDEIAVGLSSGTSGNRGVFLANRAERRMWAGTMLARILPGCGRQAQRIVLFLRANNNLYQTLDSGGMIRFRYFDLLQPLESNLKELQAFSPTILAGPPSLLRMLAEAQQAGRLNIRPVKVVSAAEVLEPTDAALIGRAFDVKTVHQVYQCTEGFLAATCRLGALHLNEDIVRVEKEYLDQANGRFIPIITDFRRLTQPMIRYRLNDILIERREPCPCGSVFTALEAVEGRCDDLFYLPDLQSGALRPIFPDFIRRAVITASGDIMDYQVRQTATTVLEISLRINPAKNTGTEDSGPVETQVRQAIGQLMTQQGCRLPTLRFAPYADHRPPGSKLRRIHRTFQPEPTAHPEMCLTP